MENGKREEWRAFLDLPAGAVADANGKSGNMDAGIKPVFPEARVIGPAFTVRCQPGDNLAAHRAIAEAPPGSVLVIDAAGFTGAGLFGEIMALACQLRGIAGVVIDGACRDAADIAAMRFPVFARAVNPGGTVKESLGVLNEPIQCGGVVVRPGDLVFGTGDGVIVVPRERWREVLARAQAIVEREKQVREQLAAGKTTLEIFGFDRLISSKLGAGQ